jgi:hypothetical protein
LPIASNVSTSALGDMRLLSSQKASFRPTCMGLPQGYHLAKK